ncbi:MAG: ferritin family protein [bacterium]|nr:ferritin family protein [bacterium]
MSEVTKEIKKIKFNNVDEVLDFAIKSEENANHFYSEWAKKTKGKPMENVFTELAAEEAKHKVFLLGVKDGKTLKPSVEEITDLKISDYMLDVKASVDMNYQDALIVAMHREKMAFNLYSKLVEMSTQAAMKDTFTMLAQEEAKHKLRLEMIYDDEILQEN